MAEKLTRVGLEVESVNYLGAGLEGVITGKVTQIERHPNSDHLWVCMMDYGSGEIVQILTGAQNVHQDDIVPVAVVGSQLPNGMKLKKLKCVGLIPSVCCAVLKNLALTPSFYCRSSVTAFSFCRRIRRSVWISKSLGLDDVVLDIDLTANRGDCTNILGLAREAAAVLGTELRLPDMSVQEAAGGSAAEMAKIDVHAADLCSRFAVRVLKNIKIGQSPEWMQKHLRACGMRPISNVVDVTNYVMLELGQPMHAYDYDKVGDHTLIVRRAEAGEKLVTLDSQERTLDPSMITIADPAHAVGLGGVMGGLETEVTDSTVNVMLEAATFNGPSIRRTSKALGLRSEASGRFERGVDTVLTHNALNRAAHLLEQIGACETVCGIVEAYPTEVKPAVVKVTPSAINTRIGVEIATEEMIDILKKLQFGIQQEGTELIVTAPSWRYDVTCDADISEEIARMHSYDKITSHMPALPLVQGRQAVIEDVRDSVEDYLASAGLSEVMTYSFIHPGSFDKLELPADDERRQVIELMNPISDEFKVMRTTLVPSILSTVAYNLARQSESVKIFEVGRTYLPQALPLTEFPVEKRVLCAAMSGKRNVLNWTEGKDNVDFYDMKGVVEGLLAKLQVTDYRLVPETQPYLHPGKSCAIEYQGELIGYFGEVHPTVAANFDLSSETYVLELGIEPLVAAAVKVPKYKHLPKFPGTSRDIAVVVPLEVSMSELEGVIRANAGELLSDVKVFDVYTGKQVADGCKSMAFNLTFQADDRTLTDAEIDTVIKNVVDKVGEEYKAKLRD